MYSFVGGEQGAWRVTRALAVTGAPLAQPPRLDILDSGTPMLPAGASWLLRGFVSNVRYATRDELARLKAVPAPLARAEARRAALIPIRKSALWWDLAQDERRRIFEESSRHTAIGLEYLPAIARRLHHCRDLGEPFDFLTWFEFAPEHEPAFDALLERLRSTEEWRYVEREVDIRLERD